MYRGATDPVSFDPSLARNARIRLTVRVAPEDDLRVKQGLDDAITLRGWFAGFLLACIAVQCVVHRETGRTTTIVHSRAHSPASRAISTSTPGIVA
jgi:hypothetical protein